MKRCRPAAWVAPSSMRPGAKKVKGTGIRYSRSATNHRPPITNHLSPLPPSLRLGAYRTMLTDNGITFPKTPSNSPRLFDPAASRMRMRWMCPGAVLDPAPGISVLFGGGRSKASAPRINPRISVTSCSRSVFCLTLCALGRRSPAAAHARQLKETNPYPVGTKRG